MSPNEPKSQNPLFRSKLTTTRFYGQNRPTQFSSVKTRVFWPNQTKPLFPVKIDPTPFFRSKSTKPTFSAKMDQNHFRSNPGFFGQNQRNPVFWVKTQFVQSKWTKTSFPSQNRSGQNSFYWSKTIFFSQNQPKPPFSADIDRHQFFRPKPTKTIQNPPFSARS